jgi:serine/threonine protein kinase
VLGTALSGQVVHLDLKPDNLMCVGKYDLTLKVTDFGVSKVRSGISVESRVFSHDAPGDHPQSSK